MNISHKKNHFIKLIWIQKWTLNRICCIRNSRQTNDRNGQKQNANKYLFRPFKSFWHIRPQYPNRKLKYYGTKWINLELFQTYLTERKQYVDFDHTKSDMLDINTGVPQGSIFAPLLFIIYINDMSKVCDLFAFIVYADDTLFIIYYYYPVS